MKKHITFLLLFTSLFSLSLQAQELTRRSFLGIQMEPVTEDVQRIMGLPEKKGVLISGVIAGSTAESAGFKKGDVLLAINETELNSPQDAVKYVGAQKSNEAFTYKLIRDKTNITNRASFKPYPLEQYPDLKVEYTQVKSGTGTQRIIITKPKKEGKLPVMVFLGGYGCYSLDSPLDTNRNELQLLNTVAREGYLTARVEKPGTGDGKGFSKECKDISFFEEKDVYVQAIRDLKKRKDVDPENIYVFGHSMGGVMGPLAAKEESVKGIIAYGTIGSNFIEYLLKTRRTIADAYQWNLDSTDAYIKDACECASYYFIDKMTTAKAAEKNIICNEHLSVFDERSRAYNDQLYSLNIPGVWKNFKGRTLLIWGEGDFIASKEDHQIIEKSLKQSGQSDVKFTTVQATHGFEHADNFQQAVANPGPYNKQLNTVILNWLRQNS